MRVALTRCRRAFLCHCFTMTRASKNTRAPSLRKCWLSSTAKGIQRKGQRKVPAMVSPPTASVQIVWLSSPCRFQPVPKAPNSAPRHSSCHCEARGKGGEKKDWMRFLWYPPAGLFLFSYSFSTLLLLQGWIHNNRINGAELKHPTGGFLKENPQVPSQNSC